MKFAITTLGCKVNQYETQAMETLLTERGHTRADLEDADVVVVNTCAVTAESTRKSRQTVHRARSKNAHARVVVCGCFPQVDREDAGALGADLVFGSGNRVALLDEIERMMSETADSSPLPPVFGEIVGGDTPPAFEELPAGAGAGRTRAYLKIEDGCDNHCAYCVIPRARGSVRSLDPGAALRQALALRDAGYRELVVTGIEISSYGKDVPSGIGLASLMERLASAAPELRLRLGSLEPNIITPDFCSRLAAAERVCPHFHLSLQSGCDDTLYRMGRRYDTARFYESVTLLRDYFPDCAVAADLITGFPGETEDDHAATLAFIEKCAFSSMHVFPFSVRPGTRAEAMSGQLPKAVKTERAREAAETAGKMELAYLESCVGKTFEVLFETEGGGVSAGHAGNYALVRAQGAGLHGLVRNVKISAVSGKTLVGDVIA